MQQDHGDVTHFLPDDVLADALGRLAPRWLAASRCVCKAWRDVIDTRRLLRADLFPLTVGGIYFNFYGVYHSLFLSRPSTRPAISGMFTDYTPNDNLVEDHCNGLLLLMSGVANPATRQWMPLPDPPPPPCTDIKGINYCHKYLVYDPTISPHYEVFQIPRVYGRELNELDPTTKSLEWPPSPSMLHVFSSKTGQWEKRSFSIANGALYVLCQADFVMRISLSDKKYQVTKLPASTDVYNFKTHFFGRSKEGLYYALLDNDQHLLVWFLNESHGQIKWELKHDKDISFLMKCQEHSIQNHGPWTLHYYDYHEDSNEISDYLRQYQGYNQNEIDAHYEGYQYEDYDHIGIDDTYEDDRYEDYNQNEIDNPYEDYYNKNMQDYIEFEAASNEESYRDDVLRTIAPIDKFEWDSDNDNIIDTEKKNGGHLSSYLSILGFHPHKEVIFLRERMDGCLAYHFNNSKVQYLVYDTMHIQGMSASFVYTPCWIG
uniref:F-box domain-containing protein n=1 Tax=Leersia perrieri TaxID=77586 RepID=A0A0D9VXD3_9ORYZ